MGADVNMLGFVLGQMLDNEGIGTPAHFVPHLQGRNHFHVLLPPTLCRHIRSRTSNFKRLITHEQRAQAFQVVCEPGIGRYSSISDQGFDYLLHAIRIKEFIKQGALRTCAWG